MMMWAVPVTSNEAAPLDSKRTWFGIIWSKQKHAYEWMEQMHELIVASSGGEVILSIQRIGRRLFSFLLIVGEVVRRRDFNTDGPFNPYGFSCHICGFRPPEVRPLEISHQVCGFTLFRKLRT
jgi:hypothetical protein